MTSLHHSSYIATEQLPGPSCSAPGARRRRGWRVVGEGTEHQACQARASARRLMRSRRRPDDSTSGCRAPRQMRCSRRPRDRPRRVREGRSEPPEVPSQCGPPRRPRRCCGGHGPDGTRVSCRRARAPARGDTRPPPRASRDGPARPARGAWRTGVTGQRLRQAGERLVQASASAPPSSRPLRSASQASGASGCASTTRLRSARPSSILASSTSARPRARLACMSVGL